LFVARVVQGETRQGMHTHADGDTCPDSRDLFEDLQIDLVRLTATAVLDWIRQTQQPGSPQGSEDLAGELRVSFGSIDSRLKLTLDDVSGQRDQLA
jgi:hypothetical protein